MDYIVKDSSIWHNPQTTQVGGYRGEIKVGIVREEIYDSETDTFFYRVEANAHGKRFLMLCRQMSKFGDVYNYEEWNLRDQVLNTPVQLPTKYTTRVGEVVIVSPIDGQTVDGVILGSLKHPSHKSIIKAKDMGYASEFNGLKTTIDNDGAWKVLFQGTPTTVATLDALPPGSPIPAAVYNPTITGTFLNVDKTGAVEINDGAVVLPQSLKIDKSGGKTIITSGKVTITMDKASQKISIQCVDKEINATKSVKIATTDFSVEGKKSAILKAPKIAIGFGGTELLDTIIKMVDAIGTVVVQSPVGACSPIASAPTWAQVIALKVKLTLIKGSL